MLPESFPTMQLHDTKRKHEGKVICYIIFVSYVSSDIHDVFAANGQIGSLAVNNCSIDAKSGGRNQNWNARCSFPYL